MKKTSIALIVFALMASAVLAVPPNIDKPDVNNGKEMINGDAKEYETQTPPPSPVYGHGGGSKCGYIHSPCSIENRKAEALRLAQARPVITYRYGWQCFDTFGTCFKIA